MAKWTDLFPLLRDPPHDAQAWRREALAGLSVGLTVIPQGAAYAALAGMPVVTGIHASLLPALVAALLASAPRLSVGPTALTALMVGASLTGMAEPGSPQWVGLAVWLALLSGALQIVLGLARFGWLLNLVSAPVMMAFTQAAALLIIASQWPDLMGATGSLGTWLQAPSVDASSLAFGVVSVLALVLLRRVSPLFPAVLVVMMVAAVASDMLAFESRGGHVVGALPSGLPTLQWPAWPGWDAVTALMAPALLIALVSFLETASSAHADSQQSQSRWNPSRDLWVQGLAKWASAASGAFPTSSSFSRSALNLYAGAHTAWASVFAALTVGLGLFLLTPMLRAVPMAVLAAVVMVSVAGLIRPGKFVSLWRLSPVETGIALATFLATLAWAPSLHAGVLVGVTLSLMHFLHQRLKPRLIEVGLHPDGRLRDRHLWKLPPVAAHTLALRLDADLDFASSRALLDRVADELLARPEVQHVALLASAINRIDATGVEALMELHRAVAHGGRTLHLVGAKLPVEQALTGAGAWASAEGWQVHPHEARWLAQAQSSMG